MAEDYKAEESLAEDSLITAGLRMARKHKLTTNQCNKGVHAIFQGSRIDCKALKEVEACNR